MNQTQKHVVVSFKQDAADVVQIRLHINGQQIFETARPDVFAGALRSIGAHKIQLKFSPGAIQHVVETEYPFTLKSAFELVDQTEGFETKAVMQLINASIKLHEAPTMESFGNAVAAWALAEADLPAELVVNRINEVPNVSQPRT